MAIDTRNKRASTLHHSQPAVPLFPNPDGSLASAEDRAHVDMAYAGFTYAGGGGFKPFWAAMANQVIGAQPC